MVFLTKYYNQLPNKGKATDDNWNHLHINTKISSAFTDKPIVAYKPNENLRSLIGQHRISDNKVIRKKLSYKGKCTPCRTKRDNLCCRQVKETSTFTNRITEKVYKIFHKINCKSKFCIYLLECTKCHNRPYVGKFETYGNERINNHRTDAKKTVPVELHFNQPGHDFTRHAKFTQTTKRNLSKTQMTTLLKQR